MLIPKRIKAKPSRPRARFNNIVSLKRVGRLAPVTGISTPGVDVTVGVGLEF